MDNTPRGRPCKLLGDLAEGSYKNGKVVDALNLVLHDFKQQQNLTDQEIGNALVNSANDLARILHELIQRNQPATPVAQGNNVVGNVHAGFEMDNERARPEMDDERIQRVSTSLQAS